MNNYNCDECEKENLEYGMLIDGWIFCSLLCIKKWQETSESNAGHSVNYYP